jgi:thioredoxin 1
MIIHLNNKNFQHTIKRNEVVLVDFYADWCGPCQALHPTLEILDKEFEGKAIISKINVDKNPELSRQFDIRSIPALFYFKNGNLVGKQNGMQQKNTISHHLNTLINKD